jgi:solute carrier family 25 citrate transporter 1
VAGLYGGLVSTCMKQGGNHGSRFMFMSEFKRLYKGHSEAKLKPMESFFGGMGAGLFSVLTTSPFDVVKTRMQSTQASQYKGTADCFMQIARNEGLTMFYSGALARCFRVVPGQGIIFMTAEYFYNVLNDKFGKKSKH